MTIRGTSNQSVITVTRSVVGQGIEHGPAKNSTDQGGAGFPQVGSAEFKESENASPGYTWTPAGEHLALGTAQSDYTAP